MVQIILTAIRALGGLSSYKNSDGGHWARDPLAHPVIDSMSLNELADLPVQALRSCCRE
jgi:hypothetical protein